MNSRQIALLAKEAVEEKKGVEAVILDVRKLTDIADYFLIVHGTSDRHVRTLADHVVTFLDEHQVKASHVEGMSNAKWVLLDYSNVIVHIFYYETRGYYNLERLWGEAKIVKATKGIKTDETRIKKVSRPHTS